MQSLQTITNSYSNSNLNNLNNSNSYSKVYTTEQILELLNSLDDVIPSDGYGGFYVNQFRRLGYNRFIELVNKARAGSDTPAKLFCWMLKNDKAVR